MPQMIDISSQRFGQLLAVRPVEQRDRKWFWLCQCDCGQEVIVQGKKLRNGHTASCGHLRRDVCLQRQIHGHTRGKGKTPEYVSWCNMWARCTNSRTWDFKYYGARGIKVCERWKDFANFFADMGLCSLGYTIERIDNDGDYEPSNCKWIPRSEQPRNKRRRAVV